MKVLPWLWDADVVADPGPSRHKDAEQQKLEQKALHVRVRVRVTVLVEPVLAFSPLVSRVELPNLASKQAATARASAAAPGSSRNTKHAQNGQKSQLCRGALDLAKNLVNDTHGCEAQSHKV